eukprot:gene6375-6868_t
MGYGQRGLVNSNEIAWTKSCPKAQYCFEAVTFDYDTIKDLIDYPWNDYYEYYFVRGCGGDYGTNIVYHPWRSLPKSARSKIGSVKLNLTMPDVITGYGGTGQFLLKYTCRHDLCVKNVKSGSMRSFSTSLTAVIAVIAIGTWWLFDGN